MEYGLFCEGGLMDRSGSDFWRKFLYLEQEVVELGEVEFNESQVKVIFQCVLKIFISVFLYRLLDVGSFGLELEGRIFVLEIERERQEELQIGRKRNL